nr:MAG TPA: hypothetical protein [Caudoviricetes sp.]
MAKLTAYRGENPVSGPQDAVGSVSALGIARRQNIPGETTHGAAGRYLLNAQL